MESDDRKCPTLDDDLKRPAKDDEDDARKCKAQTEPKQRIEKSESEDEAYCKQAIPSSAFASRPGITNVMLRELDESIAYKTGILPLEPRSKNGGHAGDSSLQHRQDSVSKLAGHLSHKTVGAAAQDDVYKSLRDENPLTVFQEQRLQFGHPDDYPPSPPDADFPYIDDDGPEADDNDDGSKEASDNQEVRVPIAYAVGVESEDDVFLPSAIEYDPDAMPPIYKNRRFRLYGLLACSLLVVMTIAGVVIVLLVAYNKETTVYIIVDTEPTQAPTSLRYTLGIQQQLELLVGAQKLNDPSSAHHRAKEWIINEDTMQLSRDDVNLNQRFLLALFYFETHEEDEWLSCNAQTENDADDVCVYQWLMNAAPIRYRNVAAYRWLSDNHECRWAGILCDDFNQLNTLNLGGQMISGTLPVELTLFPNIQEISLHLNNFRGPIPPEYGEMKYLLVLGLNYNQLTGDLPSSDWSKAKSLQRFNVAANELTGTIPAGLKALTNLKAIFLFDNFLTGTFPVEFAELSLLTTVRLQDNFLTGTLPSEFGKLAFVKELWLQRMPLSGTLPTEFGNLEGIGDLKLHSTLIEGTIPDALFNLSSLWRLDLYGTQVSGTLSSKVAQLTELDVLRIRDNNLSGTLPAELAQMTDLYVFWLEGNRFSGTVPSGLCDLRGSQGLADLVADCRPSRSTGAPPIACECCSLCCDNETEECEQG